MRWHPAMLALPLIALSTSACGHFGASVPPPLQAVDERAAPSYPADSPLGTDLDIVVVRDRATIELINRTARTYRGHQIWINQEYVTNADLIGIGTDNRFALTSFIDQYGQFFPVGAFLTPDKTRRVVLAELFDTIARERHRLIVRLEKD